MQSKASAVWQGGLKDGKGEVSVASGVITNTPYTFATRFEGQKGTNPEELIAAAHAACFSMALASVLRKKGFDPTQINTNATCTGVTKGEGFEITRMQLHVRGDVPDIDESTFHRLVMETDRVCPVSNLLREGLEIKIESILMQPVPH